MKEITALIILISETIFVICWLFIFSNIFIGILFLILAYIIVWIINNKLDKKFKLGKYKE